MRISIQPSLSKSKNAQPPPIDSTIYVTSSGVPYRMGCVRPACSAISVKRENDGRDEGSETANAAETRGAQTEPAPASKVRRNRRREEKLAMALGGAVKEQGKHPNPTSSISAGQTCPWDRFVLHSAQIHAPQCIGLRWQAWPPGLSSPRRSGDSTPEL